MPIIMWMLTILICLVICLFGYIILSFTDVFDEFHVLVIIGSAICFCITSYFMMKESDKITLKKENEMKNNLFEWVLENDITSTDLGVLKKDKLLLETEYFYYMTIPSLKELNNNEEIRKEFELYKNEFYYKDAIPSLTPFNIKYKTIGYVIIGDRKKEIYSVKNINKTLSGQYNITGESNKENIVNLKNKNFEKLKTITYEDVENDFKLKGFKLIKEEKDSENYNPSTIILEVEKELSNFDYSKILNVFEKNKEFNMNLKIVDKNKKEISYHSHDEILKEINSK